MTVANGTVEAQLHLQIGRMVADFAPGPARNGERCRVLDALASMAPDASEERVIGRLGVFLDATARNHYGVPFCTRE